MSFILLVEQAAPQTPSANQVVLYPKSDGLMYSKDDAGTERVIAQGIATQAQQETGTDVLVAVTPGRQQFHPSAAKAWVYADAAGTATVSYNTSSVTDIGAGQIGHNYTTAFSTANKCVGCTISASVTDRFVLQNNAGTFSTSRTDFIVYNAASVASDPNNWFLTAFGDQ